MMNQLCSEAQLRDLIEAMERDDADEIAKADALIAEFPDDPRLHFLRGSVLAGQGKAIEAHTALSRAVEIAPDFILARFQLGFFELTSGEAQRALATWGPLDQLPTSHYLAAFVGGLRHLIRDEFAEAIRELRRGIATNGENPPMNRDMQLIIDKSQALLNAEADQDGGASAASFMLNQLSGRRPQND